MQTRKIRLQRYVKVKNKRIFQLLFSFYSFTFLLLLHNTVYSSFHLCFMILTPEEAVVNRIVILKPTHIRVNGIRFKNCRLECFSVFWQWQLDNNHLFCYELMYHFATYKSSWLLTIKIYNLASCSQEYISGEAS